MSDQRRMLEDEIQRMALAAMAGEEQAYSRLYERLITTDTAYFFKRLGARAEVAARLAHEAVTEGLLSLQNGKYDSNKGTFMKYLSGIRRRVRADYCRRRENEKHVPESQLGDDSVMQIRAVNGDAPSVSTEKLERIIEMQDCLAVRDKPYSLTEAERILVVGRAHSQGWVSLAARLEIPKSTAEGWYHRACGKLANCMKSKGFS